ncbi:MAG: zinc-dependent peptidase [Burkholderiales bacterium]|nr:zinc-dependent peptidase [Burkholderiales bacterium]
MVAGWFKRWREARTLQHRAIPEALWQLALARFPFLTWRSEADMARLRELSTLFLDAKEFHGVQGLEVHDLMAVCIATQACLPALNLGLDWYDGFVGIVVHADVVVAQRERVDDDGVVHHFEEELSGEAMHGGPVMLSWRDVEEAGESAAEGYNVVIHEFVHVMDMRDGLADGVPALPDRAAHEEWTRVMGDEYDRFCDRIDADEHTLLDPYAAEAPEEFFAVASEAFFVAPRDFQTEHPALYSLLSKFFQQDPAAFN